MARKKKASESVEKTEERIYTQEELLSAGVQAWSSYQLLEPEMLEQVTARTRSTQFNNQFSIDTAEDLSKLAKLFGSSYPSTRENKTPQEIQDEAKTKGVGADKIVKYRNTFPCNDEMFNDWSDMLLRVITHSSKLFDTQDASTLWKNTPFVRPEEWDLAYNASRGMHVLTSDCAPIINRTKIWISTFLYKGKRTSFGLLLKDGNEDAISALQQLHPQQDPWFVGAVNKLNTRKWPLPEKVTLWPLENGEYQALMPIPSAGGLIHQYRHNQEIWKNIHTQNEAVANNPEMPRKRYTLLEKITIGGTKPENAGSVMKDVGSFLCYVYKPWNRPKVHMHAKFRFLTSSVDGSKELLTNWVSKQVVLSAWPNALLERKIHSYAVQLIERMTMSIQSVSYTDLLELHNNLESKTRSHALLKWTLGIASENDFLEIRNEFSNLSNFYDLHSRANDILLEAVKECMPPQEGTE